MSNRDSLGFGDLLPQDVVEIFAQEKHSKRGRKKRSHSLGRALGWLKGKKKKNIGAKGQNLGLGPALDLALDGHPAGQKGAPKSGKQSHPQGNSHAVPKRDDDKTPTPPLIQENVFIEASRPKYLEDLHTEALEGLKMMQQEETNNGVEYQDNESTISTTTGQADVDGGGFMSDSTIPDTSSVVSVQSSVSSRSSRSGLTRQGSTFRPLNSGKKSDKAKRRKHRKTIVGIPHHVQKELGLDRAAWALTQRLDEEQLFNGETVESPTTESQSEDASSPQDGKVINPLSNDQVEQLSAAHAGHRDDLALLQRLGPNFSGEERPRSLAVPWLTTPGEPPSPVMSMSPQAAYLSKIIPNAVLPPSIEVVEISRGRSRNSVRTVSKSSLLLSSPAPSRASSRASSSRTTSSRGSTLTSASRHNHPNLSDSSCWSNSESSETLVSDSSTISSSSLPRKNKAQNGEASGKEDKNSVHSSTGKCTSNGKIIGKGEETKKEGPFVRSLSVMKSKRAPPPPSRSYSLHNKMKRRSRDLAELRIISTTSESNEMSKPSSSVSSRIAESPGYNADTSSLDESTGSITPSPGKTQLQNSNLKKVEESVTKDAANEKKQPLQENKQGKVISPSSGYSSQDGTSPQFSKQPSSSSPRHKKSILAKLQKLFPGSTHAGPSLPPLTQSEVSENTSCSVSTVSESPSVRALRELFNIPPPPKVHAPPAPPPEVWAHSKRSFELLLGPPAPDNVYAIIKKNPKDRRQQRQSPSASTESSVKSLAGERKQKKETVTGEKVQESQEGILNVENQKDNNERLAQKKVGLNDKITEKDEKVRVSEILNGMIVKAVEKREERLAAEREESQKTCAQATETKANIDASPAISLVHISTSPSPHSSKQMAEVNSTTSVQHTVSPETSWPPPPPPMTQAGLSSPDETDFPLPPPPFFNEDGLVTPVQTSLENASPNTAMSCTTTSVISAVSNKVVTVTEPPKTSTSQGITPPPLNIPPPPPYAAPPPPGKAASPSPPPAEVCPVKTKEVSPPLVNEVTYKTVVPLSPIEEVSPPSSKEISFPPPKEIPPPPTKEILLPPPKQIPPPPPPKEISFLPPKEIPPPPTKEILLPPPKQIPPPPLPKEVSLLPPKDIPPPPPKVSLPPPKDVSSTLAVEISPPPPTEISPPPPTEISPPQPKEIPAPPPKEVFLLPPKDIPPSPPKEVFLLPPKDIPPSPPKEVSLLPPKDIPPQISLPPPKDVSSTLAVEISPPPPTEISPPPPTEISPPQPKEIPAPPPKEVFLLPPKDIPPSPPKEVSLLPPKEIPPPPKEVTLPPPEEISPILALEVSPPPPTTESSSPQPKEIPFQPPNEASSSPPKDVSLPSPKEIPPPPTNKVSSPQCIEASLVMPEDVSPAVTEVPPPLVKEIPTTLETAAPPPPVDEVCPLVVEVSSLPPEKGCVLPAEEAVPPGVPKDICPSSEEAPSICKPAEPDNITSIPSESLDPVPPLQSELVPSEEENDLPQESIPTEPGTNPSSYNSILTPPKSIPPPPPLEVFPTLKDVPQEATPSTEVSVPSPALEKTEEPAPSLVNIPVSPPVPEEDLTSITHQPSSVTTENQSKEPVSASAGQEEPTPITMPSLVQMVQSVNSSPEPPKSDTQPQPEVTMRPHIPTSSASAEAPQKPIRRSLIVSSPTSTVPPPIVTSQPALPNEQSVSVPPTSTTVRSPTKKSPPAVTVTPSMNLQEVIRMRTAARSKDGPSSRLSLHSPTSPIGGDIHKSPSSTASFIFSKSNKRVVIETKPDVKAASEKKTEVSSVTKISETESVKKGMKVPPPVAKKPKAKAKEMETGEEVDQTAGQEAKTESIKDTAEKQNGTAGTVGGQQTPLT
ncbi:proteoglycan 4-like isoform X2 [Sphaeramia orbicularis]|uniref:proteoglycan 4-like isoform X2 n=1 Tax=Sphaeramia orbicularis TaxID=375764 RepID=UPI00117F2EDC|nr:proteoglycan 4-like isoform X2 [Sphaeramia orbicularis]